MALKVATPGPRAVANRRRPPGSPSAAGRRRPCATPQWQCAWGAGRLSSAGNLARLPRGTALLTSVLTGTPGRMRASQIQKYCPSSGCYSHGRPVCPLWHASGYPHVCIPLAPTACVLRPPAAGSCRWRLATLQQCPLRRCACCRVKIPPLCSTVVFDSHGVSSQA